MFYAIKTILFYNSTDWVFMALKLQCLKSFIKEFKIV